MRKIIGGIMLASLLIMGADATTNKDKLKDASLQKQKETKTTMKNVSETKEVTRNEIIDKLNKKVFLVHTKETNGRDVLSTIIKVAGALLIVNRLISCINQNVETVCKGWKVTNVEIE